MRAGQPWSTHAGADCFFNALLREWSEWSFTQGPFSDKRCIEIPCLNQQKLLVAVDYYSEVGQHRFLYPIYRESKGNCDTITLPEAMKLIVAAVSHYHTISPKQQQDFMQCVLQSQENYNNSVSARTDLTALYQRDDVSFIEAEQALLVGHAMHPAPKSREPFTQDDAQAYAPEFGATFALHLSLIHI